jgi:hypothetical protein
MTLKQVLPRISGNVIFPSLQGITEECILLSHLRFYTGKKSLLLGTLLESTTWKTSKITPARKGIFSGLVSFVKNLFSGLVK